LDLMLKNLNFVNNGHYNLLKQEPPDFF